ncbi:hypothetical protein ACLOJK_005101 [Asimina triloba]
MARVRPAPISPIFIVRFFHRASNHLSTHRRPWPAGTPPSPTVCSRPHTITPAATIQPSVPSSIHYAQTATDPTMASMRSISPHPGVLPAFINPSSPARNRPPQIAPKSDSRPIQHPFNVHGHDPKQQTHLHQICPFRSQQNPPGSKYADHPNLSTIHPWYPIQRPASRLPSDARRLQLQQAMGQRPSAHHIEFIRRSPNLKVAAGQHCIQPRSEIQASNTRTHDQNPA